MATIEKRGPYQWRAKIRRRGHSLQSRTFNSRAKAIVWAREIESEMDRGVFLSRAEAEKITLAELIDRYADEVTPRKRSARNELSRLKLLREKLGEMRLAALQSKHVAAFRDMRLKAGIGASEIRHELNTLSHLIDTAIREWGIHIPANPVKLVRRPSAPPGRERRLQAEELELIFAATDSVELRPIVEFAIETAMRRGEIAAMKWEHLDQKRTLIIPETKTGEPRRIPLSSRAVDVLKSLPRWIDGYVFEMRKDSITQAFDRACKRAGIEDLHYHDLRHEATSSLFERGLNPMEVAAITGHKTLQMLKRYTHLRAEDLVSKLG